MSMTNSIGVVGPSHWSFMAATLAEYLGNMLEGKPQRASIPRGIYADAKQFFKLVEQALRRNGAPENPPASIKAYVVASDAARNASGPHPPSPQDIEKSLNMYIDLVNRLQNLQQLEGEDAHVAESLKKFFDQLYRDGESEAYEAGVRESTRI